MDERTIRRGLDELDDIEPWFVELMGIERGENHSKGVREALMKHRGQSYFEDMFSTAKVMLKLNKYELR